MGRELAPPGGLHSALGSDSALDTCGFRELCALRPSMWSEGGLRRCSELLMPCRHDVHACVPQVGPRGPGRRLSPAAAPLYTSGIRGRKSEEKQFYGT